MCPCVLNVKFHCMNWVFLSVLLSVPSLYLLFAFVLSMFRIFFFLTFWMCYYKISEIITRVLFCYWSRQTHTWNRAYFIVRKWWKQTIKSARYFLMEINLYKQSTIRQNKFSNSDIESNGGWLLLVQQLDLASDNLIFFLDYTWLS